MNLRNDGDAMMILRFSPSSPFVRKVRIAITLLGFDKDVTMERADTTDPNDFLRKINPLGKIPALIIEDGSAVYDSRVILDYLDDRAGGGKIVPRDLKARLAALRLQALADGILDASILTALRGPLSQAGNARAEMAGAPGRQSVARAERLEAAPPPIDPMPDVGQIALACALGYRDFRFGGSWRSEHPRLVAWLDNFAGRVPAFAATKPA